MNKVSNGMHRIYSSVGGMTIYAVVFNLEWLLNLHKCDSKCKSNCQFNKKFTVAFFEFWFNSIARNSGGAPVILIATHKDKVVSGSDLKLSNAELAKNNPAIAWAQEFVGSRITAMRVYQLNKLNLHMPPQPSMLRSVSSLMFVYYLYLLHIT